MFDTPRPTIQFRNTPETDVPYILILMHQLNGSVGASSCPDPHTLLIEWIHIQTPEVISIIFRPDNNHWFVDEASSNIPDSPSILHILRQFKK
jgi:hypothetical protein